MRTKILTIRIVPALALAILSTAYAGPTLRSVKIGSQSPVPAAPGGKGMFPITVTRAGAGAMSVHLSVSGLPAGATAAFVPPQVNFTEQGPSTKNAVLVVALSTSTPAGTYPITLTLRQGASPNIATCTSVLNVGSTPVILGPPVLNPPVLNSDQTIGLSGSGAAAQPVLVQATTNLVSAGSWDTIGVFMLDEHGLFSVIDQDATNFPVRFYRAAQ
ncbi:MAG TPA: hypothetical protein VJA21_32825 [Verrucomicrobiae bacterium]